MYFLTGSTLTRRVLTLTVGSSWEPLHSTPSRVKAMLRLNRLSIADNELRLYTVTTCRIITLTYLEHLQTNAIASSKGLQERGTFSPLQSPNDAAVSEAPKFSHAGAENDTYIKLYYATIQPGNTKVNIF